MFSDVNILKYRESVCDILTKNCPFTLDEIMKYSKIITVKYTINDPKLKEFLMKNFGIISKVKILEIIESESLSGKVVNNLNFMN